LAEYLHKVLTPGEVKTRAQVGVSHWMNSFPAQPPGGQQQRVAVARMAVGRPSILLVPGQRCFCAGPPGNAPCPHGIVPEHGE
jgi:ABC-type thiamine transport system ATPase subunit